MKKHTKKYLPLIIGAACAVGILIGSLLNFPNDRSEDQTGSRAKLEQLIDYINHDYIEDVNTDSIVNMAIRDILKSLDPHSVYISKNKLQNIKRKMHGGFIGLGIQFFMNHDTLSVLRIIPNSPAEKAGIKPGDQILYANGKPLFGKHISTNLIQAQLQGQSNSTVHLKISRPGQNRLLAINLTRQLVPVKSVTAAFMLNDSLGYLKIKRFSETTYSEFKQAITKLEAQGAVGLTLDLRDNGGGYLAEAIRVADEFIKNKRLIVFTKNREGTVKKTFATAGGDFEETKVYVLINQNTASASEVVAGALQDNDVGTIVGRRSYGKGLVQQQMPLGDGSVVRLTVARYYTPTGRSIQRPYKQEDRQYYYHDFIRRYKDGELTHKDSIPIIDSLKYITPGGKVVYGGGGIIPDVFIPKDLSYKRESLDYLLYRGVMDRFVFEKMNANRTYYNNLSWAAFQDEVHIDDEFVEAFKTYLGDFHFPFKPHTYEALLKEYLKACMAKQLFGTNAYMQIMAQRDPMILKVLHLYAEKL